MTDVIEAMSSASMFERMSGLIRGLESLAAPSPAQVHVSYVVVDPELAASAIYVGSLDGTRRSLCAVTRSLVCKWEDVVIGLRERAWGGHDFGEARLRVGDRTTCLLRLYADDSMVRRMRDAESDRALCLALTVVDVAFDGMGVASE